MDENNQLIFETPTFAQRVKSMLRVDFYRLFHTPLLYIFLCVAAMIPAMLIGTGGASGPNGEVSEPIFSNVWSAIAADYPVYGFEGIDKYANMNMVFIFGGIMVSIFIGRDYKSGYVKQIFTVRPKKGDYVLSKTLTCAFAMTAMCFAYVFGAVAAGALVGMSFEVLVGNLICAFCGKAAMSLGWAAFYTFVNLIFRKNFGASVALSFFFGTGIPTIAIGSLVGNTPVLNIFLYGSSVYACLSSGILNVVVCVFVSVACAAIYAFLGTKLLNKSDIY